jgi:Glu-tRNA(Gln) amidotransferase subunit E-like FAD-binding protein
LSTNVGLLNSEGMKFQKSGFPLPSGELVERFISFTEESLKACSVQAENSVNVVAKILDDIVAESARVSKLSDDTIIALNNVKLLLEHDKFDDDSRKTAQNNAHNDVLQQIVEALKILGKHNSEVSQFVTPMIESLQFQDRIRQQMENIPKMIRVWLNARRQIDSEFMSHEDYSALQLKFGTELLAVSISEQERVVIRNRIAGLPETESVDGDNFFF